MLKSILTFKSLEGYRTYLIAMVFIAACVVEKILGVDLPGFEVGDDWVNQCAIMLGLTTVRASVGK